MKTNIQFLDWNISGGSHIQFMSNIYDSTKIAIDLGMKSFQIFLGNPQSVKRTKIYDTDVKKSCDFLDRFSCTCFTHAPYVYNLCGRKDCLAWCGNKDQDSKTNNIIESLEYEMDIVGKLNVNGGVVIHPGVYKNREIGIETIVKTLDKISFKDHYQLLLENCAGQGDTLGKDFIELGGMLKTQNYKNIGICLDTAHIWGVGQYDLRNIRDIEKMFTDFDKYIGLEKLKLVHLNDSEVSFGSKKDRHARIGMGEIWHKDNTSFRYLLNKLEKQKIPFILETTFEDYNIVYQLYKK